MTAATRPALGTAWCPTCTTTKAVDDQYDDAYPGFGRIHRVTVTALTCGHTTHTDTGETDRGDGAPYAGTRTHLREAGWVA